MAVRNAAWSCGRLTGRASGVAAGYAADRRECAQ